MRRFLERLPLLLFVLSVLVLHLLHHDPNYQLSDAAFYMERAQDMYITYRDQRAVEGLRFQFFDRHWKPVLSQHLMLPVLALTGGDTRAAFRIYSVEMALLLALGIYFALSGWIADRRMAALGSLLIFLAPWMLSDQFEFGSEAPWLAFAAWFFGFLSRNLWGPATAALILATFSRPVENVFCLVIPYAIILFGWKFVWPLGEAAVVLAITLYPYARTGAEYPIGIQIAIATLWLLYVIAKMRYLKNCGNERVINSQRQWTWLISAVFLFFLPAVYNLVDWSWRSAVGPLVDRVNYPGQEGKNFAVFAFLSAGLFLLLPATAGLANPPSVWDFWGKRKKELFVLLWAAFALAIFVFAVSNSREIRLFHLSWMAVAILSLTIYSHTLEHKKTLAIMCLAGMTMLQAYATLPLYFLKQRSEFHNWPGWHPLAKLAGDPGRFKDLNEDTQFLAFHDYLNTLPIADDAFILFIRRDTSPKAHFSANPWKYSIRAREQGKHWRATSYFRRTDGKLDEDSLLEKAWSDGQYFVVGPALKTPAEELTPPKDQEEMKISEALFRCYATGCERHGFEPLGEFRFLEDQNNPDQTYLVFKKIPRPSKN
jgi:hypothetical protein